MESVSQQPTPTIRPEPDQAQRSAVGFELRAIYALKPDHPLTPFEDMLERLDRAR